VRRNCEQDHLEKGGKGGGRKAKGCAKAENLLGSEQSERRDGRLRAKGDRGEEVGRRQRVLVEGAAK